MVTVVAIVIDTVDNKENIMNDTIYIFIVIDGIITRLDMAFDVSRTHLDSILPEIPYCDIVNDYGNPIARAYRERDHTLARGTYGVSPSLPINTFDVLIVDADREPEFYLLKGYVNGEIVPNPNMSEADRAEEANRSMSYHPLPFGFDNTSYIFWNTMKHDTVKDYMSKDMFDTIVAKIRAQEEFSPREVALQVEMTNRMPADLAMRMRYGFGMGEQMRARADFSSQTSKEIKENPSEYRTGPFRRHAHDKQVEVSNNALAWFDRLRGTPMEKVILSKKASLLSVTKREDDAVDIYKDMLLRSDLTEDEHQIIDTKIYYMGYGRNLFNSARKMVKDGNHSGAIDALTEFVNTASGEVRLTVLPEAMILLNQCKAFLKRK